MVPEWANTATLHAKRPMWDQNLQFTPQSETTSIPVTIIWEGGGGGGVGLPYKSDEDADQKIQIKALREINVSVAQA